MEKNNKKPENKEIKEKIEAASEAAASVNNAPQQPALVIQSQYIKDMSLEIPLAPAIFKEINQAPAINVDINIANNKLEENNYNVSLTAKINADLGDKKLFIVEITYACVAYVNVPAEALEPVLFIELPRLLFPFVRSAIANNLSAAGLPPIMLNPIDFVGLFNAKKAKEAELAAQKSA